MTLRILAILAALSLAGTSAWAADKDNQAAETKTKIKKEATEGDIDEEITNARMRANLGSKSRYSLSATAAYQGGSIVQPFGQERPNLLGDPGTENNTQMGGSLSGRYRINQNMSATLGVGWGMLTPFHGETRESNLSDPSLGLDYGFRVGNWQNSTSIGLGVGTSESSKAVDFAWGLGLSHTMLTQMKEIPLTYGISVGVGGNFYNSGKGENDLINLQCSVDCRTRWSLGVYPFAEYNLNDMLALRTVFGYMNFRNLYGADQYTDLERQPGYQSVGLAISPTRDIYLYPNIQFIPEDLAVERTNFAFSATLNVF